ncbi:MAG: carboxypeptidase regulatory-like domain-containing protein [Archangium sp.]|nr:carboxypeptidase regulatory-like domain-containing protein [Archangium sp.]
MRQTLIAIVVGLGVGLGLMFALREDPAANASSPPQPQTAQQPTRNDEDAFEPGLFVAPTQPGLIVAVEPKQSGIAVQLFHDRFDLVRSERAWTAAGSENTVDGTATFPAAAGHYLALATLGDQSASLEFDVPRSSAPTRVTLTLAARKAIEGTVRKAGTTDPIPNASVRIDPSDRPCVAVARVTTDAFGRFRALIPVGIEHPFAEVSAPGFVTTKQTITTTPTIELKPGVTLDGLVVSATDSSPLQDVTVRASPGDLSVITDREGRFAITVAPGATSLHALALDGRQALQRITTTNSTRVTLKVGSGDTISGVVISKGAPITAVDVRVLAEPDDLEVARITTGPDGRFDAKGLPPGRYSVRAQQGAGRRGTAVGIELPGAPSVEVQLYGAGKLTGAVTNGDLVPVDGATVTVQWTRGMNEVARTARTDENGRFEFDELLPAEVSVQAHLGELVSIEEGIYIAPDGVAEQNLVLAVQGRLVGTVEPADAEQVWIRGKRSSDHAKVKDGRFEIVLAPGSYSAFVLLKGADHVFTQVDEVFVKAGEITTVALKLDTGDAGSNFKFAFGHPELGSGLSFENANGGVRVDFMMSDCPAAKAGVLIGDMITSIDGAPAKDALDAFAKVRKPNGEQLALGVRREGRDLVLNVR